MRASLHGCVTLEAAGGFGLPQSVDATEGRLIDLLDTGFAS
ncbi:MAG TPA: TetR-like C-terminal domain-containing protein [Ktedonobacterales bacterium]|nr:TetR-like C-terminal domain-containing protein [Ktedonobacterales bacterium]